MGPIDGSAGCIRTDFKSGADALSKFNKGKTESSDRGTLRK